MSLLGDILSEKERKQKNADKHRLWMERYNSEEERVKREQKLLEEVREWCNTSSTSYFPCVRYLNRTDYSNDFLDRLRAEMEEVGYHLYYGCRKSAQWDHYLYKDKSSFFFSTKIFVEAK